jgi:hypothetical protein
MAMIKFYSPIYWLLVVLLHAGVCFAASSPPSFSSASPSEADMEQFWRESPEFAQAEMDLNNLFKEIVSLTSGDNRVKFIKSQLQWLNIDRNEYADYLMDVEGYSKIQAYFASTEERIKHLALYAEQLRTPVTPIILSGTPDDAFCTDKCRWAIVVDGFLEPFEVGDVDLVHGKYPQLERQFSMAKSSDSSVQVSGILQYITSFDPSTVKIISPPLREQSIFGK